jgi:hypothetical protein
LQSFQALNAEPVLVGGSAVQIWTGRKDGIFETHDLDFITHLRIQDLTAAGLTATKSGRHLDVDGVLIELPSGPLAVGDLNLDARMDSIWVEVEDGGRVRVIRPEAAVLDRLAQVASWKVPQAFLQAALIWAAQGNSPEWDSAWIDSAAQRAGLSRIWEYLKAKSQGPHSADDVDEALSIGWDPPQGREPGLTLL